MNLTDFFTMHPKAALAFSGGVDSAYLLYAAIKAGIQVKPYYVKTPFQPQFELNDAQRLAQELGVALTVLPLDVLTDKTIAANPPDRCYHCKKRIFSAIAQAAKADGFTLLLDGTNASDSAGDRPGMKALEELSVLSPLRLCGLTKDEIRRRSKEAGLFTWTKSAYACLATRIPTGTAITAEMLARTERGEAALQEMGFSGFRIRLLEDCARLEMPGEQMPLVLEKREEILHLLKKDYHRILLDLEERHEQ